MPYFAAAAVAQTTSTQAAYIAAVGVATTAVAITTINDGISLAYVFCLSYGICCTTTLCNSSNQISLKYLNFAFLLSSLILNYSIFKFF